VFCGVVVAGYRLYKGIVEGIQDYFNPRGKDQLSPFGETVGNIAEVLGNSTGHGVQRAISSSLGGTMKGATAELEKQAVAENPNLALMGMMPKSIQKNPLAMIAMQQLMSRGNILGGGGGNGSSNTVSSNQGAFDI